MGQSDKVTREESATSNPRSSIPNRQSRIDVRAWLGARIFEAARHAPRDKTFTVPDGLLGYRVMIKESLDAAGVPHKFITGPTGQLSLMFLGSKMGIKEGNKATRQPGNK